MCGITGLYLKHDGLAEDLGRLTALMLHEMRGRGPDSAGFAVYGAREETAKLVLLDTSGAIDWDALAA
ncbi:MAG: amidophosphoribosyltransferase, partial [Pseudomonadota bacterium]